ncbi:MAG: flagellar biosynthesis anti-sigma factor FlgM [Phycisphaeraceae bacterium]|nr:flagellar biosynthesis anti-sigma factor FlgM [Phycisphaeraceae bacterium]
MAEIGPVGHDNLGRVEPIARRDSAEPGRHVETRARRDVDHVEVSRLAQYLRKLREVPEIRQELVDQTREAIERGDYDTPEKLEAALDRLIEEDAEI